MGGGEGGRTSFRCLRAHRRLENAMMMIEVHRTAAVDASSAFLSKLAECMDEVPTFLIGYCASWQDCRK